MMLATVGITFRVVVITPLGLGKSWCLRNKETSKRSVHKLAKHHPRSKAGDNAVSHPRLSTHSWPFSRAQISSHRSLQPRPSPLASS
ncbi:hypothetical protein DEU56DRAFT_796350 [Suillus clintonianus]|uniref:uncharacterized protein n=1 Tax=Suillus clintonianus TaxID=1904413 RepID=UPI001B8794E8|nr:uncharacterized protein DEU56DRAFT_796350 [Suillus clintonianus]KAG2141342.1 hypothetical protein DEU56DRAFT_796350 [Suillus clintonianus]